MICNECKKHPDRPHRWWCRSVEAVTRRVYGPKWTAYRDSPTRQSTEVPHD